MAKDLRRNSETPAAEPQAPPEGARQINLNHPERQLMLRVWALEDENAELRQANAELQTALGHAHAVPVPPVPGPRGDDDS